MSTTTPAPAPGSHYADPGPLGLAAFALTTFILSCANTGHLKTEAVVFGLALFYGGIAQVLAGMWEFAKGNTFGATAFTSYGAFWLSFWYLTNHTELAGPGNSVDHAIGMWLLAWMIFTAYMFIASLRTNGALVSVFAVLTVTFLFLALGDLGGKESLTHVGGWLGIVTAVLAWYTSFAGVTKSTFGRDVLPTVPLN